LIARLLVEKGIREYVQAAERLKRQYPEARFLLVGPLDPSPGGIDEAEAQRWSASGAVEYLGNQDDVRPSLKSSRIYVLPSYYREGTPRTILEAMAMGRPIITADSPGCRETVEEGRNGFLVAPRNAEALTEAMERFLQDPDLAERMGAESLKIARDKYDVHEVNEAMLDFMGLDSTLV
ncbi:MAG: glycosyltransferase, partial [Pseudomonadota bacterium]